MAPHGKVTLVTSAMRQQLSNNFVTTQILLSVNAKGSSAKHV